MVRRSASILLLLTWLVLGSGLLAHLHNLQHRHDDGAPLRHDQNNCRIHAQLYSPAPEAVAAAPLAHAMAEVAQVRLEDQHLVISAFCRPYDSRGPPVA